jgi:hypothetical protein
MVHTVARSRCRSGAVSPGHVAQISLRAQDVLIIVFEHSEEFPVTGWLG